MGQSKVAVFHTIEYLLLMLGTSIKCNKRTHMGIIQTLNLKIAEECCGRNFLFGNQSGEPTEVLHMTYTSHRVSVEQPNAVCCVQIGGSIPSCLLEAPWLRQLYLAGNSLSGQLPTVPSTSPLTTISASDQATPLPTPTLLSFPATCRCNLRAASHHCICVCVCG